MSAPLLRTRGLTVDYRVGRGRLRAVDHVDLDLHQGETLAVIGESGSGKSTIASALLRLVPVAGGSVEFDGLDWASLRGAALRRERHRMQFVPQDAGSSLDPRWRVRESVAEPLVVAGTSARQARDRAAAMLDRVGLEGPLQERFPHQLSGGQRQRVAIARALISRPRLVICDEAVSALDVSLQAEIVNLLVELRAERDLTYVFITHDIALLPYVADRVAVLYLGQVVESGPARDVLVDPQHPYTQGLLSSLPGARASGGADRPVRGEIPDPANPPTGCRFHPRCPVAVDGCPRVEPVVVPVSPAHSAACHLLEPQSATADPAVPLPSSLLRKARS
ncbi:ABC transporter ATP-binding protein [Pseudonocardia halophobica]|uniref:ABC transporter ATP-binding protein n=1 Tax=Pseudonocardia halophobica TaxID=29401 RepID=UPI003D9034D0